MMGRPRLLTPEQAEDLRRRYALFVANKPHKLARDFGLSKQTLRTYLERKHKLP